MLRTRFLIKFNFQSKNSFAFVSKFISLQDINKIMSAIMEIKTGIMEIKHVFLKLP